MRITLESGFSNKQTLHITSAAPGNAEYLPVREQPMTEAELLLLIEEGELNLAFFQVKVETLQREASLARGKHDELASVLTKIQEAAHALHIEHGRLKVLITALEREKEVNGS